MFCREYIYNFPLKKLVVLVNCFPQFSSFGHKLVRALESLDILIFNKFLLTWIVAIDLVRLTKEVMRVVYIPITHFRLFSRAVVFMYFTKGQNDPFHRRPNLTLCY
jgi:hypothetical protein